MTSRKHHANQHFGIILTMLASLLTIGSRDARAADALPCSAEPVSVCEHGGWADFALVRDGRAAPVFIDEAADPAVRHVAASFADDLQRVSGTRPPSIADIAAARNGAVVIGVLGRSPLIDGLARAGRISVADLAGQWEAFRQIVVDEPFPGVPRALLIVGADRRGAVFGTYDLSQKIGVSPWYWFADVPVHHRAEVFVTAGARGDRPLVKYRGFFINDEDPAFSSWAQRHFGGVNAELYAHVFELELRLKGNLLWPAMWRPKAFFEDDPRNMVLADEMGIVIGTTHHEPMMRAHDEWHRHTEQGVTGGAWDYGTNAAHLRTFWRGGLERMMSKGNGEAYESIVTVGMRGDGDEPMGGANAMNLLQTVVADQRKIIADVTGKPAERTPQVWALYKEVQDYYDRGMKVPDDVTLLFSDDNWGQIRRLPTSGPTRPGGFGVYYHFDYVGAPRNYKWLNTNQIGKVWQQMDLAYARGARTLWMVNVGDIKPMEFPLSFWMDMAWNPQAMTLEALQDYPKRWARNAFGESLAAPVARLITTYSHLAARRKPELLDAQSFTLGSSNGDALEGGDFGRVVAQWQQLAHQALAARTRVPKEYGDAWFQLVGQPISAMTNLYELYYAVAWNRRLAAQGDARANVFADRAEAAFRRDQQITAAYHALAAGKWDGMMSQVHIGYTSWNDPPVQKMPEVRRVAGTATDRSSVVAASSGGAQPRMTTLEASRFSRAHDADGFTWKVIPGLAAVTAFPQGRPSTAPADEVWIEYDVSLAHAGDAKTLLLYLVPTLNTDGGDAIRIGMSVDGSPVRTLISQLAPTAGGSSSQGQQDWVKAVSDNEQVLRTDLPQMKAGAHSIRIWRLDDNAVLKRLALSP